MSTSVRVVALALVLCSSVLAGSYDAGELQHQTLINLWAWGYDAESEATELQPHARSVNPVEPEADHDRYVYDVFLKVRDFAKTEPRFRHSLDWVNRRLRESLKDAGYFDPSNGIYPTYAQAAVYLGPLLEGRPDPESKSAMEWMLEVTPLPPSDLPAIRSPFYERAADVGFVSTVQGIELVPNLPFEYCSGNVLKITKRYPEAAAAHQWLYENDNAYRERFNSVVQSFVDDHEPDKVPPQDTPRLELLTLALQERLVVAGIADDIERVKQQTAEMSLR